QDASNADLRLTRNRIRHELLPHLAARYNPAVEAALARLAEQAAEAYRAEEDEAAALLGAAELPRAGTVLVFDAARLAAAPGRPGGGGGGRGGGGGGPAGWGGGGAGGGAGGAAPTGAASPPGGRRPPAPWTCPGTSRRGDAAASCSCAPPSPPPRERGPCEKG